VSRKFTTLLLAGGLTLLATKAQAQTTFSIGPQVGLTVAGASNPSPGTTTIHYRTGFEAGLQSIVQFGHLAVQPSLHFSQKGLNEHYGRSLYSRYTDYRLNYLTLPLNVAYSLRPDGQGLQVFAGPYVGMLLGGNYQLTSDDRGAFGGTSSYEGTIAAGTSYTVPAPGSTAPQPRLCRRFDAGLQVGLGYRFGKLLAQAEFAFGLNDLYPLLPTAYNRTAQASLSYLFTPKR
jgi:hypothetical protein